MPSTVVDAGPLIALFDPSDREHSTVKVFLHSNSDQLLTNMVVVGEVAHFLGSSRHRQREFLAWIQMAITVDEQTTSDLPRIIEIMAKYDDLPADFADASLVALCERRGIDRVASFDSDFDVYRTRNRKRLQNVLTSG